MGEWGRKGQRWEGGDEEGEKDRRETTYEQLDAGVGGRGSPSSLLPSLLSSLLSSLPSSPSSPLASLDAARAPMEG